MKGPPDRANFMPGDQLSGTDCRKPEDVLPIRIARFRKPFPPAKRFRLSDDSASATGRESIERNAFRQHSAIEFSSRPQAAETQLP
jgi:hypothetical protein